MPLVSLLVPIYGVEKFIEKCAVSLFEQTYSNIEYVFVDDCTPDNSISVLRDIIAEYPGRKSKVRILHHETMLTVHTDKEGESHSCSFAVIDPI